MPRKAQKSTSYHKAHTPFTGNIILKTVALEQPSARLYAEALIALARQLEDLPGDSQSHGAIASGSTSSHRTDPPTLAS
jgi:hypothetical protein